MISPDERRFLDHLVEQWLSEARWARFNEVLDQRTRHITVVMDNLYQPHNASAVMRSCEAMGVQDLHLIQRKHGIELERGIAKGAEYWMTTHRYEGDAAEADCVDALRRSGYRLVATTPHTDDCSIEELPVDQPIALLFGEEKPGLSPQLMGAADAYVRIPMVGFMESYNVSVSVALCLYELLGRMRRGDIDWGLKKEERERLALAWARRSVQHVDSIERRFFGLD